MAEAESRLESERSESQEMRINSAAIQALLTSTQWMLDQVQAELQAEKDAKAAMMESMGVDGAVFTGSESSIELATLKAQVCSCAVFCCATSCCVVLCYCACRQ